MEASKPLVTCNMGDLFGRGAYLDLSTIWCVFAVAVIVE